MLNGLRRRVFAFTFLALLAMAAVQSAQACDWLQYDPQVESVRGTLTIKSYEDPREVGSRKLKFMVLELAAPLCMKAQPSKDFNVEERDVQRIQLVVSDDALNKPLHAFLRKKVVITGKLFHQFSALHVEKVLIGVTAVRRDEAEH
jgi:hypothetical protein